MKWTNKKETDRFFDGGVESGVDELAEDLFGSAQHPARIGGQQTQVDAGDARLGVQVGQLRLVGGVQAGPLAAAAAALVSVGVGVESAAADAAQDGAEP